MSAAARRKRKRRPGSPHRERYVPSRHPVRRRTRWLLLVLAVAAAVAQFVGIWTFDDGARRAVDALYADSILDAKFSSRYRIDDALPDRTPQLEELVLAFDAAVPDAYSDGVARRELSASPQVGLEIAVRLVAAAGAVVIGFVALRLLGLRLAAARARRRALRTRRLDQLARTARLADAVLAEQPDDPARARARADAAGRYVLVLARVEAARDEPALVAADAELTALERTLAVRR